MLISLGTPLHGILGSVQLLADTNLDPFQTGLANTIKTSSLTLNETLTSVLPYARINQFERQQHKYRQRRPPDAHWSLPNKLNLPPGPDTDFNGLYISTNIALLCEEIAGVLEAGQSYDKPTDQRNVAVVVEIDYEKNWNYLTEPGALRRIALNVIGNALKYTTEGSVIIKLAAAGVALQDTNLSEDDNSRRTISLTIKDTGRGISKDFMDSHLFVPFTQEDTTTSDGVGLGMSIVKSLVSLLAGEIRVDSKPGKGTDVAVITPMRVSKPEQGGQGKPASELERLTASLRKENLSVLLYGFPRVVRQAFEKHLCEWFKCKLLESTEDAEPDIVMVEEGNDEATGDAERTSQHYGRRAVLLSIAMGASALAKSMRPVKGYRIWERSLCPIGPNGLGKALSVCALKLRELRTHGDSGEQNEGNHEQDVRDKNDHQLQGYKELFKEGPSITSKEPAQVSLNNGRLHDMPSLERQKVTDTISDTPLPYRSNPLLVDPLLMTRAWFYRTSMSLSLRTTPSIGGY
jgi:hypothetical protein